MYSETRNMADYEADYHTLPFEHIQTKFRRAHVLGEISRKSPKHLLEIGCGTLPLFTDLAANIAVTVIEPVAEFAANAHKLAQSRKNTFIVHGFVEDFQTKTHDFDMIVLSCLLHEVPNPAILLAAVRSLCRIDTVLHINVPNARSLHRLLATAMGLIPEPGTQSNTQLKMQQRATTYEAESLRSELVQAGFTVTEQGSLFVKPFAHAQMQQLVDQGFITLSMLEGFDKLVHWLPDLGSEIWVNVQLNKNGAFNW